MSSSPHEQYAWWSVPGTSLDPEPQTRPLPSVSYDEFNAMSALDAAESGILQPPGPPGTESTEAAIVGGNGRAPLSSRIIGTRLSAVAPLPIRWLWRNRFPRHMVSMIYGDPGTGKSFITLDMAARVSRGEPWPDGEHNEVGDVVILTAEDDLAYTVRPRLDACRGDPDRVYVLQAVRHVTEQDGATASTFSLGTDLPALREAVTSMPDTRLVIIDPVSAYCGKVDSHRNTDIRGLLTPLCEFAESTGVALVCVTHLNKSGGTNAIYRATGSLAFVAAARANWMVCRDPKDPTRRLMLPTKCNPFHPAKGLAYTIESEHVEGVGPIGCVYWSIDPVEMTAQQALAAEGAAEKRAGRDATDDASAVKRAAQWLVAFMGDEGISTAELKIESRDAGFSNATIRRALDSLEAESYKQGYGSTGKWCYRLPAKVLKPPRQL